MGGLRAVVIVLTIASVAILLAAPISSAAGDTVKINYQDNPDITVVLPNGKEIKKGTDLIITLSSDVYDVVKSGIIFYRYDSAGKLDRTTSITPVHKLNPSDGSVTYTFSKLDTDIEMEFSDLEMLIVETDAPAEPVGQSRNIIGDSMLTIVVMIVSSILAAAMLTIMTRTNKIMDSTQDESEMTS